MIYELELPDNIETKRVGKWGHNIMWCRYPGCNYCTPSASLILRHILKCPHRDETFAYETHSRRPYVPVDKVQVKVSH
jgi:hypothetical protein